jgi:hypothetical protein
VPVLPRRTAWIAVTALLVVAGVGVVAKIVLKGGDEEGGANARPAATSSSSADVNRGAGESASPASNDATRSADPSASSSSSPARPPTSWKPGPPDGYSVHVVDARGGKPIPGAHLVVIPVSLGDGPGHLDDGASRVAAAAVGFVADAHGWARVEWPAGPAWVVGESGDLRGMRLLEESGRDDFELRLAPKQSLQVEVVNRRGAPLAGAGVAWAERDSDGNVVVSPYSVVADDHGRATLERGEGNDWRSTLWHPKRGDASHDTLGVAVPWIGGSGDEPAAFVALGDPEGQTIRCTVSAEFGTFAVHVGDGIGRPVDEEVYVTFTPNQRPRVIDSLAGSKHSDSVFVDALSPSMRIAMPRRGSGSFAPVALGLDFMITAEQFDGPYLGGSSVKGPQRDGEVVRVELNSSNARVHLHGRIVGAANPWDVTATLGSRLNRPWLVGSSRASTVARGDMPLAVRIGAGGEFALDMMVPPKFGGAPLTLVGFDGESGPPFVGEVELLETAVTPDVDLGDVVVHSVPLVVSGRVLDPTLRPALRAVVHIDGMSGDEMVGESGRFRFVGETSWQRRLHLVVHPFRTSTFASQSVTGLVPGLADAEVDFDVGTRDLEVVLERQGSIAGLVLSDQGLTVVARRHGSGTPTRDVEAVRPYGDSPSRSVFDVDSPDTHQIEIGSPFRVDLRPGRYDILFTIADAAHRPGPIASVLDVTAVAGETNCDPRLNPLDLRGAIGPWRFTLERIDGAPPPSIWVRLGVADREDVFLQSTYVGGSGGEVDSSLQSAWVDVVHPGFRRIHELHQRGDVKLVLQPIDSTPFIVHVDLSPGSKRDGIEWRVRAEPPWSDPVDGLDWFSALVDGDGDACLDLDEGEHWRIHLFVVDQRGNAERRREIERVAIPLTALDLERGSIELHVDRGDTDAALAALEKMH